MKKLNTLRRNIDNHKAERQRAANQRELAERMLKRVEDERAYPDVIMDPPQGLVDLYCSETEVYARANLLGDSSRTREQMADMLHTHLADRYRAHQVSESLGICNRWSYWKPSAKLGGDRRTIEISLATKLIGTIS